MNRQHILQKKSLKIFLECIIEEVFNCFSKT